MPLRQYSRNSDESEKAIERHLCRLTKAAGGLALKYYNPTVTGYPDRILLFPDGSVVWVELKTKGERPTALQSLRIRQLREDFNQKVYVCDSKAKAERIVLPFTRQKIGKRKGGDA